MSYISESQDLAQNKVLINLKKRAEQNNKLEKCLQSDQDSVEKHIQKHGVLKEFKW